MPNNGATSPYADYKAREMAQSALSAVEAMREVIAEREVNGQRRWDEATRYFQASFGRIEAMVQTMQNTYRDSVETLAKRHDESLAKCREEFDRELRDLAISTDKRLDDHHNEDDERFTAIDGWRWKLAYAVIGTLATTTLTLAGALGSTMLHR